MSRRVRRCLSSNVIFGSRGTPSRSGIYAEDPDKGFIPSPGKITSWSAPNGPGVRLDAGFEGGQTVSPHYDPMIAKLIVHGADRGEAIARLAGALEEFAIAGIRTGLPFLRRVCEDPVFAKGAYDTSFIETQMADGPPALDPEIRDLVFGAAAVLACRSSSSEQTRFGIALPKSESLVVEVVRDDSETESEVRVGEKRLVFSIGAATSPLVALLHGGAVSRFEFAPRKKGGFDVGLRDRNLRLKLVAAD